MRPRPIYVSRLEQALFEPLRKCRLLASVHLPIGSRCEIEAAAGFALAHGGAPILGRQLISILLVDTN